MQTASVGLDFYKTLAHAYFLLQAFTNPETDNSKFITITVNKDKFSKLKKDDDEVMIDGVLYDIKNAIDIGGKTKLLLKSDEDETNWNIHYAESDNKFQKEGKSHTAQGKSSISFIPLYYNKETIREFHIISNLQKVLHHTAGSYSWPVSEMNTPPPRSC